MPVVENNAVIMEVEEEADVCAMTRSKAKAKESSNFEQGKGDSAQKEGRGKPCECTPNDSMPASSLDKHAPAYTYELKAMNPTITKQTFSKILDVIVPSITVGDLLAISPDIRKEAVDYARTQCIPSFTATNELSVCPPLIEYSTPLCELKVTVNGVHEEIALLDDLHRPWAWFQRFDGHLCRFFCLHFGHCIFHCTDAVVGFLKLCSLIVLSLLTNLVVSFLLFRGTSLNSKVMEDMTRMQVGLALPWPLGHGNEHVHVNEK